MLLILAPHDHLHIKQKSASVTRTGLAVDSGRIYWANSADGTVKEAPLTGGPARVLARRRHSGGYAPGIG